METALKRGKSGRSTCLSNPYRYNGRVEKYNDLLNHPENLIRELKSALRVPLPGEAAQKKMAPPLRDLRPEPGVMPRRSAVLALLYGSPLGISLLFTLRPRTLAQHGGQISFPGGMAEEQDATLVQTALREVEEEVGLPAKLVQVLGCITSLYISPSQTMVYPFVGWIPQLPSLHPSPVEVEKVLEVPLTTLLDPKTRQFYKWQRNGQTLTAPCYQVNGSCIWGATAMMVSELLDIIKRILGAEDR